mmetsp:Transcript_65142/g.191117  ORF Transcript_65142/g.191117 Transcript_65142/m.191117 type:complete len:228 (+) Transcript_65142:1586-2269(+)
MVPLEGRPQDFSPGQRVRGHAPDCGERRLVPLPGLEPDGAPHGDAHRVEEVEDRPRRLRGVVPIVELEAAREEAQQRREPAPLAEVDREREVHRDLLAVVVPNGVHRRRVEEGPHHLADLLSPRQVTIRQPPAHEQIRARVVVVEGGGLVLPGGAGDGVGVDDIAILVGLRDPLGRPLDLVQGFQREDRVYGVPFVAQLSDVDLPVDDGVEELDDLVAPERDGDALL